jgi:hypothetical protein
MAAKILSQERLRKLFRQYGYLLLFLFVQFLPPFASRGYLIRDWGLVNGFIITHPIKGLTASLYPVFQLLPLFFLAAIPLAGNRIRRWFSAYVAITYILFAGLQNVSISEDYGLAFCTPNIMIFLALAGLWIWECFTPRNDFSALNGPVWKYWAVLFALFALWEPINHSTLLPDFNPLYLFTSGAGLSFCMATPLYLALLSLYYPAVNKPLFVSTGFVGLMMASGNMLLEFILHPAWWWLGVLHLPLLIISLYCLALIFIESNHQINTNPLPPTIR